MGGPGHDSLDGGPGLADVVDGGAGADICRNAEDMTSCEVVRR
jgi:hypothetical protein